MDTKCFRRHRILNRIYLPGLLLQRPVLYNASNADYVFSYGGKITEVIKKIGIPEYRIIEIPTGIEEEWLNGKVNAPNGKIKFVYVGRFERRKGIEELNKALQELNHQTNMEFHFIGPIPESKKIKSSFITYHGAIMDAEVMKAKIREMDVLVCPSHSEGMPNVIMEAMASGLAVIASDVGAVSSMVSSANGILIKAGDRKSLVAAMQNMLSKPKNTILQLKQKSLQLVENEFLWSRIITQTIEAIEAKIN